MYTNNYQLIGGADAEIHGYPLKKKKSYTINEGGVGIHSWKGCQVEVSGSFDDDGNKKPILLINDDNNNNKQTQQTAIKQYLMAHAKFRKERDSLQKCKNFKCFNYDEIMLNWSDFDINRTFNGNLDKMGPRILILGDVNTGKSTLCKSLINWAQRLKDEPIFIDVDCGQNSISLPGTICGDIIKDYHIPWKSYEHTNNVSRNPFIYYFGNTSPSHYIDLYKHYISTISMTMKKKMLSLEKQRCAGSIINTCGWTQGPMALSIIKHIITSFSVNHIIVMKHKDDQEEQPLITWLNGVIKDKDIKHKINICQLSPTKSVKLRDSNKRYKKRQLMCRQYFYGDKIQRKRGSVDQSDSENEENSEEMKNKDEVNNNNDNGCIEIKKNEEEEKNEKRDSLDMIQFVDEWTPFERSYLFNEITFYEIRKVRENGNNYDSYSSGSGSGYSYSSSSDRESNNNNNNNKNNHKKQGINNRVKTREINCSYIYDDLDPIKFVIKSRRFQDSMIGHIVAVTHAQKPEELLKTNVAGFLYIKDVDPEKKEIRVLQTCVGPLPGLCLYGEIKWDINQSNYKH